MDLIRESSFAQYLIQSALEEGIERGLKQGIEQGSREFLLDVLALCFPVDQVRPLADRIGTIDDAQHLKRRHTGAQPRSL